MAEWNAGPTVVESAVDTWGTQNTWKQEESTYNDASNWNSGGADAVASDHGATSFHHGAHAENGENGAVDDKCFSCGETGHRKAECTKAEAMECHFCHQVGHMVKDCPDKPPMVCENCGEEGHMRKNCENARKINRDSVKDVSPEEAWDKLKAAVNEKDVDDVKEALQEYVKATGGSVTYRELQESFIGGGINLWLIANERSLVDVFTNMDLQGNMGKRYSVSYRFSQTPERPRERDGWPQSREELLSRLDNAGDVVDIGIVKCGNCKELGHPAKYCPQEKVERMDVRKTICFNCGAEGHRVRDCPEPRVDKFACKNCGKSGHKIADCEEPPNLDNVECRKCNETGHFAKDCPQGSSSGGCRNCGQEGHIARDCEQPPNLDNVVCRNCEKTGHFRRECPEPTDWSKVQCTNCQEYGHTKVRCKKAPTEESNDNKFSNNFTETAQEQSHIGGQAAGGWGAGGTATIETNASFNDDGGW